MTAEHQLELLGEAASAAKTSMARLAEAWSQYSDAGGSELDFKFQAAKELLDALAGELTQTAADFRCDNLGELEEEEEGQS